MADFRALCAELLASYEDTFVISEPSDDPLVQQARAALAQPEPEGPTDEELLKLANEWDSGYESIEFEFIADYAKAVLQRWGRPAIKPVPVSERLPGLEDCDAEGRCWWGRPSEELCNSDWFLATHAEVDEFCDAWPPIVFLPHWALPVPTAA